MSVDLSNLYDRKFLVFSDESGTWNDSDPDRFYVRSWIKITPHEYKKLCLEVQNSKNNTSVKELKWDYFRKNPRAFGNLFSSVNFDIFITISKPSYFLSISSSYHIIQSLSSTPLPLSEKFYGLEDKIREKILGSVRNELFFNYFERTHIKNSKTVLAFNEAPQNYAYVIDHPQYSGSSWTDIATECGIDRVRIIRDSQNCPGIELADVVVGCINNFLIHQTELQNLTPFYNANDPVYMKGLSDIRSKIQEITGIFGEYMGSKMTNMLSSVEPDLGKAPNPNFVFHEYLSDSDKDKLRVLRQSRNLKLQNP